MLSRNNDKNKGINLFVDVAKDLTPVKGAVADSWYVKSDFIAGGKKFGFTWHQGMMGFGPFKNFESECVFMNITDDKYVNRHFSAHVSKTNGVEKKILNIFSDWGYLKGDVNNMELHVDCGEYKMTVTLKRKNNILYNGATGLIDFGALKSYEYAFPDMEMNGILTFDGKEYKVESASAWFDRQWGMMSIFGDKSDVFMPGKSKWMWLGLVLDDQDHTVFSLWDYYTDLSRRAFVTTTGESGYQLNANADITYDKIWTSRKTGFSYPRKVNIKVPAIQLDLELKCCTESDTIEFEREKKGLSGCQCLYLAKGTYKQMEVNTYANLEMIGNICG
jgi:predicted secreted hydrolase